VIACFVKQKLPTGQKLSRLVLNSRTKPMRKNNISKEFVSMTKDEFSPSELEPDKPQNEWVAQENHEEKTYLECIDRLGTLDEKNTKEIS
jgi:hypothetical protein